MRRLFATTAACASTLIFHSKLPYSPQGNAEQQRPFYWHWIHISKLHGNSHLVTNKLYSLLQISLRTLGHSGIPANRARQPSLVAHHRKGRINRDRHSKKLLTMLIGYCRTTSRGSIIRRLLKYGGVVPLVLSRYLKILSIKNRTTFLFAMARRVEY